MENAKAILTIEKYEECIKTPVGKCNLKCDKCVMYVSEEEIIEALNQAKEALNENKGFTGN